MRRWTVLLSAVLLLLLLCPKAQAAELPGQADPEAGLTDAERELIGDFDPNAAPALGVLLRGLLENLDLLDLDGCLRVLGVCLAAAVLCQVFGSEGESGRLASTAACLCVSAACVGSLHGMLAAGTETITRTHEYVRLLLPGMTVLGTVSGHAGAAGAVHSGAAIFFDVLLALLSGVLVPLVRTHAALCAADALLPESRLGKLRDFLKWLLTTLLKWVLYGFSAFLTASGLFAATVDAQKLRAARTVLSGMAPAAGGLVSEAAQSVLSAAETLKNAVGVYGMAAVLAICLGPFLKLWVHYLTLKLAGALCGTIGAGRVSGLLEKLSETMGVVVSMTGVSCVLALLVLVLCVRMVIL